VGPVELVLLVHGQPRHPPTLAGKRVTGVGQLLLLHEQLLARSLPLVRRHDRGCVHCEKSSLSVPDRRHVRFSSRIIARCPPPVHPPSRTCSASSPTPSAASSWSASPPVSSASPTSPGPCP